MPCKYEKVVYQVGKKTKTVYTQLPGGRGYGVNKDAVELSRIQCPGNLVAEVYIGSDDDGSCSDPDCCGYPTEYIQVNWSCSEGKHDYNLPGPFHDQDSLNTWVNEKLTEQNEEN
jgi:hypothetical protein